MRLAVIISALIAALALVLREMAWAVVGLGLRILRGLPGWLRRHVGERPFALRLSQRYPRSSAAVGARLGAGFTGLPLTLLCLAVLYLAALFGGMVEDLLETEGLVRLDTVINQWLQNWRVPQLVALFAWVTVLGDSATLIAVGLVGTGFLWAHHRSGLVLPLWVAFLGSQATTWLGKFALGRHRPDFVTEVTALSASFPSAHATGAMAVYGFLAYAIARDLPEIRQRFELSFWTAILILVVSFSRMFLSVHFASDVAAGLAVGGFWLLVGFVVAEYLRLRR
ncbi:MAG: phosphatase PAP2 family protein [Rhodospirillales bacterium]|nr:phosphatase PAP2 family protein [Rhodospirillales bacterium]